MSLQRIEFDVSRAVLEEGVRGVVLIGEGFHNRTSNPAFESLREAACQKILSEFSEKPLHEDPVLQGFRDLHTRLGFSNRNYPAASESLLQYLLKNRRLPSINLIVDIYNLVSVETRLSLGAHDLAKIDGNVHLRVTTGLERFVPLGATEPKQVRPGGYAYIDDGNEVICLLEVKQVEKTKATLETRDCLFIVQGNACTPWQTVREGADRLAAYLQRFCGGEVRYLYTGEPS